MGSSSQNSSVVHWCRRRVRLPFWFKSFTREGKQGNRASHVSIHVHNCSNRCTTDCFEHGHQKVNSTFNHLHFEDFSSFWRFFLADIPSKPCAEPKVCHRTSLWRSTRSTWIQAPSCRSWLHRRTLHTPRTKASIRFWRTSTITWERPLNLRAWHFGFGHHHHHLCQEVPWNWTRQSQKMMQPQLKTRQQRLSHLQKILVNLLFHFIRMLVHLIPFRTTWCCRLTSRPSCKFSWTVFWIQSLPTTRTRAGHQSWPWTRPGAEHGPFSVIWRKSASVIQNAADRLHPVEVLRLRDKFEGCFIMDLGNISDVSYIFWTSRFWPMATWLISEALSEKLHFHHRQWVNAPVYIQFLFRVHFPTCHITHTHSHKPMCLWLQFFHVIRSGALGLSIRGKCWSLNTTLTRF